MKNNFGGWWSRGADGYRLGSILGIYFFFCFMLSQIRHVGNLALLGNHGKTLLALPEFLPNEVLALVDDLAVKQKSKLLVDGGVEEQMDID
jgi:hypothetical protein